MCMTVEDLIKKLECYDKSAQVLIEVEHGDMISLKEEVIEEDLVLSSDLTARAFEEDKETESVVVIRINS